MIVIGTKATLELAKLRVLSQLPGFQLLESEKLPPPASDQGQVAPS